MGESEALQKEFTPLVMIQELEIKVTGDVHYLGLT